MHATLTFHVMFLIKKKDNTTGSYDRFLLRQVLYIEKEGGGTCLRQVNTLLVKPLNGRMSCVRACAMQTLGEVLITLPRPRAKPEACDTGTDGK